MLLYYRTNSSIDLCLICSDILILLIIVARHEIGCLCQPVGFMQCLYESRKWTCQDSANGLVGLAKVPL